MNELVEKNLSDLVEELTISGSLMLNDDKIKQLKQICKSAAQHTYIFSYDRNCLALGKLKSTSSIVTVCYILN